MKESVHKAWQKFLAPLVQALIGVVINYEIDVSVID
jgi:hypothetical protein